MARNVSRPAEARRPVQFIKALKTETVFVCVSGIGMLQTPEKWEDDTERKWLEHIDISIAPGLAAFHFPYEFQATDNNLWIDLIESGSDFLNNLRWLVEHEKIHHCPIVIVAHSLGGLIVKEALSLAYEDTTGHRRLLRSLAAIFFLGTPHTTVSDDWKILSNVLQSSRGNVKRRAMSTEDMEKLAKSSRRFEEASVDIPIISAYETQKTRIRKALGFTSKTLLIEEKFTITNASEEYSLALDGDHRTMCNIVPDEDAFKKLCTYLDDSLKGARSRIVQGSPEYVPPSALGSWSVIDEDEGMLTLTSSEQRDGTDSTQKSPGFVSQTDPLSLQVGTGVSGGNPEFQNIEGDLSRTTRQITFPIMIMPITKNREFFARETELTLIEKAFFDSSAGTAASTASAADTPKSFAICAPGGMGKTQIAVEFIFRFRDRYDAIFWVNADKAAKIADSMRKIAFALGLMDDSSVDAHDPVIIRELVKGWLANPIKSPNSQDEKEPQLASWLLVFDNADEPDELEDYWPLDGPGCVLFTSRDPLIKNSSYLARRGTDLEPFSTDESSAFLSRLTKREGDGAGVAKILGGLPLAITQIASVIVRRALSYEDFVQQYEEEESRGEIFEHKTLPRPRNQTYEHNIATVWALDSLRQGAILLKVLSFLDPDGISERILKENPHNVPMDDYPRTTTRYLKAREELIQCSLINKNQVGERVVVHRLVQDLVRSKMEADEYRTVFMTALTLVSSVWPYEAFGWRHGVARWKVCAGYFPHIARLLELSRPVQPELGSLEGDITYVKLMNEAGWYHHENGNSSEARSFFDVAQRAAEKLKSIETESDPKFVLEINSILAEIHHNFGCVGTETNDPEGTLKHFLAFKDLLTGGGARGSEQDDMKVSIAWNELGNAWMLNKDWSQGEDCFKQSIALAKESPAFEPIKISFPMVNLGLAYFFTGRLEQAASVLEEGLHGREAKYGKNDKDSFITGRFLHALGNVKHSQGQMDKSMELHQRCLEQYLSTLGKNHHRTGDVQIKVAEHYAERKNYKEAITHINEALRIFRGRDALRHEYCRALVKRSLVLGRDGQTDAAKADMNEALNIYYDLHPEANKDDTVLTEAFVDEMIAFWSR